ncbi:hypothetical protein FC15_GL000916 [Lapidilactobacillus concavus DSM 17758]|jgi:uncharacterized protein YneF (UPF0154 family)|uniref:UPF0154 protein FC15_GL000916 n=1 Tax=Lapidilactobacillus concavus DSM 17758 TaxID=1423735 RepID=A0A0R1WFS6_9LACO|nr:YneF family protein [Lapidilactobacillus concavus]KRM13750.1 hypothetical protein FC15_GL000916 [Lapidilactobacillus concavus DSM 17758]GEL12630.1 hypothetical protein LCO01nite_01790 [Lapidilactobacillus concavus]
MSTGLAIVLIILALILGAVAGFFGARAYMKKYFRDNPPVNEDMMRTMMVQMGQKPSEKKLHQMMTAMKAQQQKSGK